MLGEIPQLVLSCFLRETLAEQPEYRGFLFADGRQLLLALGSLLLPRRIRLAPATLDCAIEYAESVRTKAGLKESISST